MKRRLNSKYGHERKLKILFEIWIVASSTRSNWKEGVKFKRIRIDLVNSSDVKCRRKIVFLWKVRESCFFEFKIKFEGGKNMKRLKNYYFVRDICASRTNLDVFFFSRQIRSSWHLFWHSESVFFLFISLVCNISCMEFKK